MIDRGNSIVVQFDSVKLNDIVDGSMGTVDVLGTYTDARYSADRSYWDGSVLHGDLTVVAPAEDDEGTETDDR